MLREIVRRHPYACATVLFVVVMTFVKFGAIKAVDNYGLLGCLAIIGGAVIVGAMMDRHR